MINEMNDNTDPMLVERELVRSEVSGTPWYRNVSWGAILAGAVIALLAQTALEMLGIAIGAGAIEPGEDQLGPSFTSAVVIWMAASVLLSLFAGGWATARLARTRDRVNGMLHAGVMMGLVTFITLFLLTSTIGSTLRGVSGAISDGLSFVGTSVQDVSATVADAITLQDDTLAGIRAEAEELLADDASLTSLRLALDDYLLGDEPGDDTRQAAITALTTQTTLTEEEATQRVDRWSADFQQTVDRVEAEAEQIAGDVTDIIATTAGVIFMIIVAGFFAAAAGGYVAASALDNDTAETEQRVIRRQRAEVVS